MAPSTKTIQIHYNDSPRELRRVGTRFLTELFADFNVSPQQAVQDFSDSCRGKNDEINDIAGNRANYHILSGTYTDISVGFNSETFAEMNGRCEFVDIPTQPSHPNFGKREHISGTCQLTAVYENWRWLLCESHFLPPFGVSIESLRNRVPGQIMMPREPSRESR